MYIDGFVAAVKTADKQIYVDFANRCDAIFVESGATRVVDGWAGDVPRGKLTDFYRAVAAEDGEEVVFGWIEWPDKSTRDAGFEKAMKDERMQGAPPFDGKRMIFGGFDPVVNERWSDAAPGFIDAFVAGVPASKKDLFVRQSTEMAETFRANGALFDIESYGDDVPEGKVTSFKIAVKAEGDEVPGISVVGWPDKATRDAAWAKMMEQGPPPGDMPFDGKRMFFGGFDPVAVHGK